MRHARAFGLTAFAALAVAAVAFAQNAAPAPAATGQAATVTPLPWNLILLVAAAVLPTIAVMLANAIDLRREPETATPEPVERPALTGAEVVGGSVVEENT